MEYTTYQKEIFNFVENGAGHGIIDACAGSGKTTTIIKAAEYVKDRSKTLFCAFNRSVRIEIERKFKQKHFDNITVKTMHALGFDILKNKYFGDRDVKIDDKKLVNVVKSYQFIHEFENELTLLYNLTEKEKINDNFWEKLDPNNSLYDEEGTFSTEEKERQYFYRLPPAMQELLERIVEINRRYRLTFCKPDKNKFKLMLEHFSFPLDTHGFDEDKNMPADVAAYLGVVNASAVITTPEQALTAYYKLNSRLMKTDIELANYGIIDYVDMLYFPSSMALNLKPDNQFEFVFIDECQDLSKAQLEIAMKYCSPTGRILAVGDPQQSIYGFAGADSESFPRIKSELNARELPLSDCFRCPQKVISLAKPYKPSIVGVKKELGKVEFIIGQEKAAKMIKPGNMVISRTRDNLIDILFFLLDQNVKCYIHHDNVEEIINDLRSIFTKSERTIVYKKNELDWNIEKIMRRIEKKVRAKYFNCTYLSQDAKTEHISHELKKIKERVEFIFLHLKKWRNCSTITDVLIQIKRLISDESDDSVKLSTVHRAKGLENDVVFLLGANKLPMSWEGIQPWEQVQENNLTYVAYTRAKQELYLVEDPNNVDEEEYERKLKGAVYTDPGKNCHD